MPRFTKAPQWPVVRRQPEECGAPSRHALPEGHGSGIIWRLLSITRYFERDGGVYIGVEAMG